MNEIFKREVEACYSELIVADGRLLQESWQARWLWFLLSLTFVIWGMCAYFPESLVVFVARLFDRVLWGHIVDTNYNACVDMCRAYAFGLIAPPICWALSAIGGTKLYRATIERNDWFDRYQLPRTTGNSALLKLSRADARSYFYRCGMVLTAFIFLALGFIPAIFLSASTEGHGKNFFDSSMQIYWAIFMALFTAGSAAQGFYIAYYGDLRDPPDERA